MPSMSRGRANEADEHTQLLAADQVRVSSPSDRAIAAQNTTDTIGPSRLRVQILVLLFVCVLYFNFYVTLAPEISIREAIICKAYYDKTDDFTSTTPQAERDCTVDGVQRELTLVNQVYLTLSQLPALFLTLPYGILSDRVGRKKVLLLAAVGLVACESFKLFVTWQSDYFPLRAIWLAPLFRLIGGADAVAATVLLATLADVYTGQDRTIVYARVASMATTCELLAPLVSSALMLKNPWLPVILGFSLAMLGMLTTLLTLPETLPFKSSTDNVCTAHTTAGGDSPKLRALKERFWATVTSLRQTFDSIFAINGVIFLLFSFFAVTIGTIAGAFELQYTHKRFGWSYSFAASILTLRPSVTLVVLLIVIPIASNILTGKLGYSSARKDLLLSRASAALLCGGTLLLSVSETSALAILSLVIFALGNAYTTVARSLLTTIGPQEMTGTLLSAMNVSASLGAVIAGPIIAVTFDWGLKQGGIWVGAPLLIVGLLYGLTLGFVCLLSVSGKNEGNNDDPE